MRAVFRDMFGSFSSGRIGRLRFVGLTLLLDVALVAVGLLFGLFAGVMERLDPYRTLTANGPILPALGLTAFTIIVAVSLLVIFGTLNLVAKRARDIGWSPELLLILCVMFSGVTWIVLAIVPGKADAAA